MNEHQKYLKEYVTKLKEERGETWDGLAFEINKHFGTSYTEEALRNQWKRGHVKTLEFIYILIALGETEFEFPEDWLME